MYCGTVPTRADLHKTVETEYFQFAEAYVLGDKLRDSNFKDAIIDTMLDKSRCKVSDGASTGSFLFPGEGVIRYIYDNPPRSSEARHLLVYLYAENGNGRWLNDATQELFPKEFLMDLAVVLLEMLDKLTLAMPTAKSDTCKYHQHGPGPCYRDRFNHDPVVATAKQLESTSAA